MNNTTWPFKATFGMDISTLEPSVTSNRYLNDGHHKNGMDLASDIMDVIVTPAFCFIGVVGNIVNLAVLLKSRVQLRNADVERNSGTTLGLVLLSVSDLLFCLTICPRVFINLSAHMALFPNRGFGLLYQTYGTAFITTFLLTSTWITVAIATLRYLAICHPLCMRKVDANKLSKFSYIFSGLFAICLNLPAFGEYRIDPLQTSPSNSSQNTFHYIMDLGYFSSTSIHGHMFMWIRAILGIFVPTAIMTFCYVSLILALRRSWQMRQECFATRDNRNRHSNRITRMLITLVLLFIILVFPCEVMDFCRDVVQTNSTQTQVFMVARSITNVLQVMNFSCNFILYCTMSVHFRRSAAQIIYVCLHTVCGFRNNYQSNLSSPSGRTTNLTVLSTRV